MLVTRKSSISGEINSIDLPITEEQIVRFESGELIQRAFPQLTAEQREFILTGITPEEWKVAFPDEDEDEDVNIYK